MEIVHSVDHFEFGGEVFVLASANCGVELFKLSEVKKGGFTGGSG